MPCASASAGTKSSASRTAAASAIASGRAGVRSISIVLLSTVPYEYRVDPPAVHVHYLEPQPAEVGVLARLRQVAESGHHQTRDRAVAAAVVRRQVELEDRLDVPGAGRELPHQLLDYLVDADRALHAPELVEHDGHVLTGLLERLEHAVDRLGAGHEERRLHHRLQLQRPAGERRGEDVRGVRDAEDVLKVAVAGQEPLAPAQPLDPPAQGVG